MQPNTRDVLQDRALLEGRDAHFSRLKSLFAGHRLERPFLLSGVRAVGDADPYQDVEQWVREALDDLAAKADLLRDAAVFRPLVLEFGPYGVHFVDALFGAGVFELHEKGNWQTRGLPTPVGQLKRPDLDGSDAWQLARAAAVAFVESGATVPLFGLPTIASALNVAVNLYGEGILLAMRADPEAARRDLGVINEVLCDLHRWYRAHVPVAQLQPVAADGRTQPPEHGQLCGCTTQLLSRDLYCDFVAPLDDELLSVYRHGGMIHLCGTHTQHIPTWRAMKSVRAVQVNDRAALDLAPYFRGLRQDQVVYVNPCAGMSVEQIMDITGGQRVVIVSDPGNTRGNRLLPPPALIGPGRDCDRLEGQACGNELRKRSEMCSARPERPTSGRFPLRVWRR